MTDHPPSSHDTEDLLRLLVEAGKIDTAYRDIYLHHALSLLEPLLPLDEFRRLSESRGSIDDFVRRSRVAAERGDWEAVREATERIAYLRSLVAEREALYATAEEIYHPRDVVIDPFSPGLEWTPSGRHAAEAAARIGEILVTLEQTDGPSSSFYRDRRLAFARFPGERAAPETRDSGKKVDAGSLRREALQAAERGDVATLDRLLRTLEEAGVAVSRDNDGRKPPEQRGVEEPFPDAAVARAPALGMVAAEVQAAPNVSGFLWQRAWQPHIPDQPASQDGHLRLLGADDLPPDVPDPLREALEMFLLHVFVNSAGVRYVPACGVETFLVEDFAEESPDAPGPLLDLLGLPKRRGLSRIAIETALLHRGPAILREHFAVDPCRFRLVCIPCDLYARWGNRRGWGNQPLWTHFDGYQLLKGGGVRALVGGDVRYGGIYDLCSISDFDAREGVTARFAVVRRERMLLPPR